MGIQLFASLLGLILGTLLLFRRWRTKKYKPPLPPGSYGLPFLGESLYVLRAMARNELPEFFQTREKKYGDTFKTHLFGVPTVVVCPPAGLRLLFQSHNTLVVTTWPASTKILIGDKSLFFMQGDRAKSFRHILMAFLGREACQRYVGRLSLMIEKQIDEKCSPGAVIKAYDLIKQTLFMVVFELFFSLNDVEEQQELLVPFQDLFQGLIAMPLDFPGTKFHKAVVARRKIFATLDKYLRKRRMELAEGTATAEQDLLSLLLTTRGESGELMSDEEIKQNVLLLVIAGHDTSSSSLISSIKCIAENPQCYDKLRQEHMAITAAKQPGEQLNYSDVRQMKYTWNVVQEAMRLLPPTTGFLRKALVDFELDGYMIPKGWQLLHSQCRSNKKAEFFPEPNRFNPDRFSGTGPAPYTHAPFGGGPRICPGYEQAKMQDCVFLHHLVTRFKWSLVDPHEILQMAPLVVPAKGLPLKLQLAG